MITIGLDMMGEGMNDVLNTILAMAERVEAGEDVNQMYTEYFDRQEPGIFGDMVDIEESSIFEDFIEGELGIERLDDDPDEPIDM